MRSVLSKQTGSNPSSKQHLIAAIPLAPDPMMAILFPDAILNAGVPQVCYVFFLNIKKKSNWIKCHV